MPINVTISGDGLRRFEDLTQIRGSQKATAIYSRAINDTGAKAATETGRALADHSGLAKRTSAKAMKKRKRSTPSTLAFEIATRGGQIRVKYFRPKEQPEVGITAYTSAPTLTATGGGSDAGKALPTLVAVLGTDIDAGKVVSVTITNPGKSMSVAPTIAFTGGAGTGATAMANIGDPFVSALNVIRSAISRRRRRPRKWKSFATPA